MDFEYDPAKSAKNREKHGIDFNEARGLWNDEDRMQIPARSDSEPRFAILARLDDKIWGAFYTVRNDSVRIISIRRARTNEREFYECGGT